MTLLTLALLSAAHAGWTRPEGGTYLKVWDLSLVGDRAYDTTGDKDDTPEDFAHHSLHVYAEHGLTDHVTLVGFATPIGWSRYGENATPFTGDNFLGLRQAVATGRLKVAIEGRIGGTPGPGEVTLGEAVLGGEPMAYVPAVRTAWVGGELQAGTNIGKAWVVASGGGRVFSRGALSPVLTASLATGRSWDFGLGLSAKIGIYEPLGPITIINPTGAGQTAYQGVDLGASWALTEHLAANTSVGIGYARSNASTPGIAVGLEWQTDG
jgi:hypothetical protein